MIRFRRYRVFVFCAFAVVFLLYRVSQNSQWEAGTSVIYDSYSHAGTRSSEPSYERHGESPQQKPLPPPVPVDAAKGDSPRVKATTSERRPGAGPTSTRLPNSITDENDAAGEAVGGAAGPATTPKPNVKIPDRQPNTADGPGVKDQFPMNGQGADGPIHIMDPPGQRQHESTATSSMEHWRKMTEHFSLASSDVISLPTGKPKAIPSVQTKFGRESEADKMKRESRLVQVQKEMARAWGGYRKHAWGHDELTPVTKKFRDPFCGWAATLVDAMDTLWIMGMREEFDEAYDALDQIDFTTTPYRSEIPVFETIIRYLGGLVAAFDVSGGKEGKYPKLLRKAEELAEILMGVFDTPNRMPILYYNWKPEYASQPQRAGTSVSIAEIGSMSMEFTRLAQLTGNDRYYDAIARITDALEDWQRRGTALNGIFPQQVDASGCNRTATDLAAASRAAKEQAAEADLTEEPSGYSPSGSDGKKLPSTKVKTRPEFTVHEGDEPGAAGKAEFDPPRKVGGRSAPVDALKSDPSQNPKSEKPSDALYTSDETVPGVPSPGKVPDMHPGRGGVGMSAASSAPYGANGQLLDWDCVPQNLTSGGHGLDTYSMGGSQDSAYEYFPKQYVLLGGLVPKYRAMHERTVAAVKKYLLFRPMLKNDRNVLFAAKAYSRDGTDKSLTYDFEVSHLACFLGGMFGLGGRVFGSEEDVEIASRLTDGCVWAYEATASGVMPEYGLVVPCRTSESCPWNDTVWYDHLDPNAGWRDTQLADFERRKEEWIARKEELLKQEEMRVLAEEEAAARDRRKGRGGGAHSGGAQGAQDNDDDDDHYRGREEAAAAASPKERTSDDFVYVHGKARPKSRPASSSAAGGRRTDDNLPVDPKKWMASTKKKRSVDSNDDADPAAAAAAVQERSSAAQEGQKNKLAAENLDLSSSGSSSSSSDASGSSSSSDGSSSSGSGSGTSNIMSSNYDPADAGTQAPLVDPLRDLPPEPNKPLSHLEYVARRIKSENIPPGYTSVIDRRYILRPEAIESVWYMYRITGDRAWQEKGWRMFQAVIKATSTSVGHSAVDDVVSPSAPQFVDNMESFWMAETLKYFYLLFTTPDVISLDEWVLNTEAHPFRRPR